MVTIIPTIMMGYKTVQHLDTCRDSVNHKPKTLVPICKAG